MSFKYTIAKSLFLIYNSKDMLKRDKSLFLKIALAFMFITGFASCQLFEADVADFMEKYTETAGIEEHEFNVETYNDALSHLCISSESDTQLSFFMRNPKSFNLIPSVHFPELDETISTEFVTIQQTDKQTINLSLPTSFLVPADMGNNITAEVSLYEPMSGREFDHYKVDLHCNTIPPQIINPVIMNSKQSGDSEDVAQYFIIAFDMPNEDAVAVRHTDISQIVINGVGYPVTIPEPVQDSEGVKTLIYGSTVFSDTKFTKALSTGLVTGSCPYTVIGDKSFTPNRNSYYFATGESFVAGNKEYTIQLKDDAGLTSTVTASTTIRKLNKPVIHSIDTIANITTELSGTGAIGVPYNEESGVGVITITPPATDHKGDPVSGVTVYYKIYEATGLGRLYTSGSTATTRRIELPQNTYRVEAYAVRTNYEQSATENLKIRLVNNVIYIEAVTDLSAPNATNLTTGDGSVNAPFPTIQDAIDDINDPATDRKDNYTFYIKGDFTSNVYSKAYPAQARDYSGAVLNGLNTQEITIAKWPGANVAKLKTIQVDSSPTTLTKVKIGDITLRNNNIHLDFKNPSVCYEVDGTVIQGTDSTNAVGIYLNFAAYEQNVIKNCTISGCLKGIQATSSSKITIQNGSITSCDTGIETGNNSRVNLYGGSITGNQIGINVYSSATLNVQGSPVVNNNLSTETPPVKQNIMLPASKLINVTGALASSCRLSVTTTGAPANVGDPVQEFTSGFRANNATAMPSSFFYSDSGLSVVLSEDGQAGLVVAGASGPDIYSAADYNFTFAVADDAGISETAVYPSAEKVLKITPAVTRAGSGIYYNYADKKFYTDASFTPANVVANGSTVSWSAAIYSGSRRVGDDIPAENITDTAGGIKIKFTAPANIGSYTLKVFANFLELPHTGSFPLACYTYADNAAAAIAGYTSGQHNVTVTGSISPDDLVTVADALHTHDSDGVLINLDAYGTTNANDDLDAYAAPEYNNGAYFFGCNALKSMKLPEWMEGILPGLFWDSGLTSVELPNTITDIYESAFRATGLTSIDLPASLEEIGAEAFYECTALTTINFAGTKEEWGNISRGADWHKDVPATQVHCTDGYCSIDYIVLIPLSSLSTAPTEGNYSISTLNELKQIRDWVNGSEHHTLENVNIVLEADIDTEGEQITIGHYKYGDTSYAFKGSLDGKGHKITNTIHISSYDNRYDALINYLEGGTVRNLTVAGTSNCNSLVGYCKNGTIDNCVSETNITIPADERWILDIGGIVGKMGEGNIVVKNCINTGNITINRGSQVRAGGIVGLLITVDGEINRCINKGNITSISAVGFDGAGGIVGDASLYKYIRNSKNFGTISCYSNNIGGITGTINAGTPASANSQMICNCCNLGDVCAGIPGTYGSSLFALIRSKPNLQNNCSACNAKNGFAEIIVHNNSYELTSVDWILNNYCMEGSFEDGKLLGNYPNDTATVQFADTNVKAFSSSSSEVDDVIESLNDWVSTHNTTPGTYATWKKNAAGKPELDLGELDD